MDLSPTMPMSALTADFLKKKYLTGLIMCDDRGQELGDDIYEHWLITAITKLEEITNVDVLLRVITAETHDYRVNDYVAYGFLQLHRVPALDVTSVRAVYPTGQTIQVFPHEWVRLEQVHSQLHLVPTSGTLSQVILGQGADYLPLIYSGLGYLPQLWEVDYSSGFDPDAVPRSIIDAIAKLASLELLQVMSDTVAPIGQSSQSLSVDGLSQSRSYQIPAFQARIAAYKADLGLQGGDPGKGGLLGQIRNNYLGIVMASI
jgi:hypothetical protein